MSCCMLNNMPFVLGACWSIYNSRCGAAWLQTRSCRFTAAQQVSVAALFCIEYTSLWMTLPEAEQQRTFYREEQSPKTTDARGRC